MNAKKIHEKMIDYKQFATVLLTVGVFFFLGTIIPSATKVTEDIEVATAASVGFLSFSILFFSMAKMYRNQLNESEEGQDMLMKK